MAPTIAWVLKNPLTSALIGGILLMSAGTAVQSWRLNGARAEAAEARAALSTKQAEVLVCETNTATLEDAVEDQNAAVQDAREAGEAAAADAAARAREVLRRPLPATSAPGADAMNTWLESL
ncbi:MAG: hypothetical protein RBS78_01040 [Coriobacteriia bacterium]|jgi:hypothetical protein|nr:hypothetical protein [Coriobacteriia bacterium]